MDKIITLEAEIVADTKLIVEGATEVEINTSKSITAEIAPDTYVLGSIGSFNTASSWVGQYVNELVRESIGTGGTLKDALNLLKNDMLDEIDNGVNQVITQVENEYVSNSTLTTTLGSAIGGVRSSILNIENTYATQDQAQAYAIDAIKSSFGGNSSSSAIEAYIGNIALTQVDQNGAWAGTTEVLIASMNETLARIDTMDSVLVTTTGWAASASKLITAPDGSITGWAFADGSDSESTFKIKAQNFEISNGVTGHTPFSISGSNVQFNGKVSFTSLTDVPQLGSTPQEVVDAVNAGNTTTIDGGKITTGSITADQIAANTITTTELASNIVTIGQEIKSSNFTTIGGAGFRLKSAAAGTSADPTIYGAYIKGGTLEGSFIRGGSTALSNIVTVFNKPTYYSLTAALANRFVFEVGNRTARYNTQIYTSNYGTTEDVFRLMSHDNTSCVINFTNNIGGGSQMLICRADTGFDNNNIKVQVYIGTTLIGESPFIHIDNGRSPSSYTLLGITFWFGSPAHGVADWYISRTAKLNVPSNITAQGEIIFKFIARHGYTTLRPELVYGTVVGGITTYSIQSGYSVDNLRLHLSI